MIDFCLQWLLAPVLWMQGQYVRRTVPTLPEPEGERSGMLGSGASLGVLILGDSAAAGVGVGQQRDALSGQLVQRLAEHYRVTWTLAAATGYRVRQLPQLLDRVAPGNRDVVLISVGVNDVTGLTSLRQWRRHLRALQSAVRQRLGGPQIIFTRLPPMQAFPALPQPTRWFLGRRAAALNRVLAEVVESAADSHLLAIDLPLEKGMMAADGFHPGAASYGIWAQAAAATIEQVLERGVSWSGDSGRVGGPSRT